MLHHLEGIFAEDTDAPDSRGSIDGLRTPVTSISSSSELPVDQSNPGPDVSPVPKLESLPRPDQLFLQSRLYIISMRVERDRQYLSQGAANATTHHLPDRLVLQSTHEQSLKLVHDYFTKWTRPDPQSREKVPLVRHTLSPSAIGHGSHDTLVVEPFSQVSGRSGSMLNPVLYQCFIERVLGYETVYQDISQSHNGASWEFRRTRPFA